MYLGQVPDHVFFFFIIAAIIQRENIKKVPHQGDFCVEDSILYLKPHWKYTHNCLFQPDEGAKMRHSLSPFKCMFRELRLK